MKSVATFTLIAALATASPIASLFAAEPRGDQPSGARPENPSGANTQVGPGGAGIRPPERLQAAPLTEGECKGLGGKVFNMVQGSSKCADTGKACVTVDQDGVIHSTCITKE